MCASEYDFDLDRYAAAISDLRAACRIHVERVNRLLAPPGVPASKAKLRRALGQLEKAVHKSERATDGL